MHKIILTCLAVLVLTTSAWATHVPDPHDHEGEVHAQPWEEPDLNVVIMEIEVMPLDDHELENVVVNKSKTMRAFIVDAQGPPEWQCQYIYFQDLETKDSFVILGVPLGYRPFSGLIFVQDRYLVFDRWSQPDFGWHYVVDTQTKKLVLARPVQTSNWSDS